jgi:hypothetical protein
LKIFGGFDTATKVLHALHMAKIENNVTVTVDTGSSQAVYTAPVVEVAGWGAKGFETLGITLRNYKRESLTPDVACAKVEGYGKEDDMRKEVLEGYRKLLETSLKGAETSALEGQIKMDNLLAEIEQHKRDCRHVLLKQVNAAIQAGLSVEELTAGMNDGWAGNVQDIFNQVYVITEIDTAGDVS